MTIWTAYPLWLAWLSRHGYRKKTLKFYRQAVTVFGAFWGQRSLASVDMQAIDL